MVLKYFSILGYASILLWMVVPILWVMHVKTRPRRWLCHIALVVALCAYVLARVNSLVYVNRIQVDRSEEIAAAQARQEKARQAALDARSGDVADVQFAEDDSNDSMDQGGMDEADLKYMQALEGDGVPAWKKDKKTRSSTPQSDDSLEGMLDKSEKEKGAETAVVEQDAAEPIMMPERDVMAANRLDGLNLKLIRLLILIGVGVVLVDYLKRANIYEEAYLPVPIPSRWREGLTPLPTVQRWPDKRRRSLPEELTWLLRRGENFLYLTNNGRKVEELPERACRIRAPRLMPVEIIHADDGQPIVADFIFGALWYGRSSFAVGSAMHAARVLERMLELMEERKLTRAHVRQTVHIVWDMDEAPSDETLTKFERLGAATGFSLVLLPR